MVVKAKTYVFGDFSFEPSESLLLKHGKPVSVPPKALNVLERLVENAGSVVTKDDLIRDVWDDMAIEESAVPRTVFVVRTALGDDPKNHVYIQTVSKRGYRFVADVTILEPTNGREASAQLGGNELAYSVVADPPTPKARPRRYRSARWVAALLLLGAATTGAYFGYFRDGPVLPKRSLLVMPITAAGGADGDELLENGIADALIHYLGSSKDLTVRPFSITRSYADKITDPTLAGREQQVSKVLSATYQRADGKLRIRATLINVETGETDEPYIFETVESGVFAIQDAIVADLGSRVALRLGAVVRPGRDRGTTNEEAYRHFFQGMALYDKRNGARAVESFERAIVLDPNFARAWIGKAVALGTLPSLGNYTSPELYDRTLMAVDRALALDPGSGEAYSALCAAKLTYAHDFQGAGQACLRAMELDPTSPVVLQSYSFLLISQGRLEEGIWRIQNALEIEPTSFLSHSEYANALYLSRRYSEAHEQYVRLIELQPERLPTYEWMIRTLEASGREAEAVEWLLRSLDVRKADPAWAVRVKQAYLDAGWQGVLRERIEMENESKNFFRRAGVHARLGNRDAAFELLERAYAQRSPIFVTLNVEPQFDPIRDDPRFQAILDRMRSAAQ